MNPWFTIGDCNSLGSSPEHYSTAVAGQPSKLDLASLRSNGQTLGVSASLAGIAESLWGVFGLAGIELVAGFGVAAIVWLGASGDAAKANS